jgi:hypothetical protein
MLLKVWTVASLITAALSGVAQPWVLQAPPLETIATLAEWPLIASVRDVTEIRVTNWHPTGSAPSAVLRLTIADGQTVATAVVWWGVYLAPSPLLEGPAVRCMTPPEKQRVCIKPIATRMEVNWADLARTLLAADTYRPPVPKSPLTPPPPVVSDDPKLFTEITERGQVRFLRGLDDFETLKVVVRTLTALETDAWFQQ